MIMYVMVIPIVRVSSGVITPLDGLMLPSNTEVPVVVGEAVVMGGAVVMGVAVSDEIHTHYCYYYYSLKVIGRQI